MLRSLCLLAAVLPACAFNDDGQLIPCFDGECETDTTTPPSGPDVVPHPVRFAFDRGANQPFEYAPALAKGGTLNVVVTSVRTELPSATASSGVSLETTPLGPYQISVDVHGDEVGSSTLSATIPSFAEPATMDVRVAEVATIGIAAPFGEPSDHMLVLPDVRKLALYVETADGKPLIDHSLALDPVDGFALDRWDSLSIPATVGDYPLSITRATGELHRFLVRVLDHVDDIATDATDLVGHTYGTLCVKAIADGEPVETGAFTFAGTPGLEVVQHDHARECADFLYAAPGAAITVEVGGVTKQFSVF